MPVHPLLAVARKAGNPVIEGKTATLIWQGRSAPWLIDDVHNWEENPQKLKRIGPGLWSFSMRLDRDAYIEYGFLDPKSGGRMEDPLNRKRVWNGINEYNHYFYMPGGGPNPLPAQIPGVPRGKITRFQVQTLEFVAGAKRTVVLYQPPVQEPVPLLVVYDGTDFLRLGKLNTIADNLIAQKRVRPFAMALVKDGGHARYLEYACSESTLEFILNCVLPLAREILNLTPPEKQKYGVAGASMGGLMALYTSLRLPKLFGKAISLSGAFNYLNYQPVVMDVVRHMPHSKIELWIEAGHYEWLLESNRQMAALLTDKNYQVKYHEFSGGHNFTSWRNEIWRALETMFPVNKPTE